MKMCVIYLFTFGYTHDQRACLKYAVSILLKDKLYFQKLMYYTFIECYPIYLQIECGVQEIFQTNQKCRLSEGK